MDSCVETGALDNVLMVEDLEWPKVALERELGDRINLRVVKTIEKAREAIKEQPFPDLVIVNALLDGPISESQEFVQELRAIHPGLRIVGTSNDSTYRDKLVGAGCDYATDHGDLPPVIEYYLSLA